MTTGKTKSRIRRSFRRKPYAILGAGRLVSTLWNHGNENTGPQFHFNLFRMKEDGRVDQRLGPSDLFDLVKLARLLAVTLFEEGGLSSPTREQLKKLVAALDPVVTQSRPSL